MTGHVVSAYMFACDDCGREWGANREYQTAIEARGSAYAAGWRFPPRLTTNRNPSQQISDVCPDCLSSHEPSLTRLAASKGDSKKKER